MLKNYYEYNINDYIGYDGQCVTFKKIRKRSQIVIKLCNQIKSIF